LQLTSGAVKNGRRLQLNAVFYGRNGTLRLVVRGVRARSGVELERRLRRGLDGAGRAGALLGVGQKLRGGVARLNHGTDGAGVTMYAATAWYDRARKDGELQP
jgi:hypothetical protein